MSVLRVCRVPIGWSPRGRSHSNFVDRVSVLFLERSGWETENEPATRRGLHTGKTSFTLAVNQVDTIQIFNRHLCTSTCQEANTPSWAADSRLTTAAGLVLFRNLPNQELDAPLPRAVNILQRSNYPVWPIVPYRSAAKWPLPRVPSSRCTFKHGTMALSKARIGHSQRCRN